MNSLIRVALGALALVVSSFASAQWPERPMKLVAPFPPGNSSDIVARVIAEKLGTMLGQPVVVDNRVGAGGTLGTAYGAQQAADGYTLLIGAPGALSIAPWIKTTPLPYDPLKDFVVLGAVAWAPQVLVVNRDFPAKNFQEFLAYSKRPGVRLQYGSAGVGTTGHLIVSQMLQATGLKADHIPYRGGAQVVTDVRGGIVHFTTDTVPVVQGMLSDGSLKALGVTTAMRIPSMPSIPTLIEQGANVDMQGYILIVGQAKLPQAIVQRLRVSMDTIVRDPDVRKRLIELGLTPMDIPKEDLDSLIQTETAKWKRLVELAGATKSQD